jgi:hypothetical protein
LDLGFSGEARELSLTKSKVLKRGIISIRGKPDHSRMRTEN